MSERRFNKLQNYATYADKIMIQVIDELIDSLPSTENGDSDAGVPEGATLTSTPRRVKPAV